MARMRIFGLAAVTIWFGLVAAGSASADGLDRFKKAIEPLIPAGALKYKSAKALGDDGFVLEDAVFTPPPSDAAKGDKQEPVSIKTVTVERLDFDAIEKQQPPLYAKVKFDGMTSGANAGGLDLKQMAGIDYLSADFGFDYKLDPDKKIFTLRRLELNLNGLAKLQTSFVIDNVEASDAAKPDDALKNASLKSADLIYEDQSLLAKALPIAAAFQGSDAKALIAMAIAILDGARADQGPAAQKAIDSLVAYLEDWQKPKGALHISLNPAGKVTDAQLNDAKTADEIVKLLGVQVSYSGTRSSKPGETAAPAGVGDAAGKGAGATEDEDSDENNAKTLDKKKD